MRDNLASEMSNILWGLEMKRAGLEEDMGGVGGACSEI